MLGLVLPQLVAKAAGEMALRWPRLGFSSHFLQPIYLSLQKTSASPLSLSTYLSKYRAPLKFQLYLRKKNAIQGGRESGARCLPPRLVPTRALRQEGGFPTRTQRLSPIPHGPAMNPGQREHRRRELLDRRISPPLEESRRWAWWAETPVLVDAKPGGESLCPL